MVWEAWTGSTLGIPRGCWERPSASPCAASRDSTSARRPRSPAQAESRNAARLAGSRSSASPTISLIFCHISGVPSAPSFHLSGQPRLRYIPVPLHSGRRDAEHLGDLFRCQSSKETHFHDTALLLVELGEIGQRIV